MDGGRKAEALGRWRGRGRLLQPGRWREGL